MKKIAFKDLQFGRQIGKTKKILVDLSDTRMIEMGYRQARMNARSEFGIDDGGHSDCLDEWERSSCDYFIELVRTVMAGSGKVRMIFRAWAEKCEEDDE